MEAARELLSRKGSLGGSSSGTLLAAALRYCREQKTAKRVVTLVCDSGNKYLSKCSMISGHRTGIGRPQLHGDLSDLIARRHDSGGTVTVSPDETLMIAYNRMRTSDVSQLPVVKDDLVVGFLDESDILPLSKAMTKNAIRFAKPVKDYMTTELRTVQVKDKLGASPCLNATKWRLCWTVRNLSALSRVSI